jgi:hypothetical protein
VACLRALTTFSVQSYVEIKACFDIVYSHFCFVAYLITYPEQTALIGMNVENTMDAVLGGM